MAQHLPDTPAAQLTGSTGPIHAVSYSSSPGTYILTGSADRSVRLYNPFPSTTAPAIRSSSITSKQALSIPQGRLVQTYNAHGYEVLSLAVASDNHRFASSGGDRAVFLWDVSTATTIRRFAGHGGRINAVKFAGDGESLVVSGGFDTSVRLWDCKSSNLKPIQCLEDAKDAITTLAVFDKQVIAGSVDGRVRSYDVRMGKCTTDVIGASVTSLDTTRDGRTVVVGSLDSKIRLMDRDTGKCLRAYADSGFKNTEYRVQSILGGKEKYILAGDEDPEQPETGRLWAWDLLSGNLIKKINVPWGPEEGKKRVVGRDGKEKVRRNVVSCLAWREGGWGDQYCVGGTSGIVTVFGAL
ncbi:WD40-repeat-containing domain protein [Emericellopsis atlantica]|uniref:WD40-repeat-containing domain protein n=1 Tax=Emericellopsis atlantica TaxID=2614577 RepID=A0A9P7ZP40_9HYPO|nr:WD40-repeat-containing domain protein [Emericellopsis atlantica]KAG9255277.1 WD40-repeat-containing domain protein [Emericellopsis atlantica]